MTDRRDEGFAVATQRIGGGPGGGPGRRRRRLAIGAVVAGGVVVLAIAVLGPRLSSRPNLDLSYFGTPSPSAGHSLPGNLPPTQVPGVTPLPFLTQTAQVPGVRLGVAADGFRVLDLGAGTMSQSLVANPSTDAVVRAPNGSGWMCICMLDLGTVANGYTRIVDFVRIGPAGNELDRVPMGTIDGGPDPANSLAVKTDILMAPDGRSALLAVAQQRTDGWHVVLARVDLVNREILDSLELGSITSSKAPRGPSLPIDISGPTIRRSPDGRSAFVWTTWAISGGGVSGEPQVIGWRVAIDTEGKPTASARARDLSRLQPSCTAGGFVRDDRFVAVCPVPPAAGSTGTAWRLTELDLSGRLVDSIDLPETTHFYVDPLLDTANGVVWIWNPTDLVLLRVEAEGLRITSHTFDGGADEAPGAAAFGGRAPAWAASSSSVLVNRAQQIVGSPDGSRLYLLAYGPLTDVNAGRPPSRGTLVVDPRTLALTGNWPPDAAALGITPVDDGSIVAIAGLPGADANGNAVAWQGSLTFHRADDGGVLAQFGQLGDNYLPLVVSP